MAVSFLLLIIDVHDFRCNKPFLEEGIIEKGREFHLDNKRKRPQFVSCVDSELNEHIFGYRNDYV